MAANATFALKAGVWVRRVRLLIVSPDSTGTACPLSGRNSIYRPVQISEAGSVPPQSYRYVGGDCVALLKDEQFQTSHRHKRRHRARGPSARTGVSR